MMRTPSWASPASALAHDGDADTLTGEVAAIYTRRRAWGRGWGHALMDAAAARLRDVGYSDGGVAMALVTYKSATGDPSNNFIGITNSYANTKLTYAVTSTAIPALQIGTHQWTVTTDTSGNMTVTIDGTLALNAHVTLPPTVYLALTGGTGGPTDVHTVTNVAITANT